MSTGRPDGDLRVLHLITDRDRRGAQVFATDLADGLGSLGVDSTVAALAPGSGRGSLEVEVLGPSRRSPRTLTGVRSLAGRHDVVVAHGSTTLFVAAVALAGTGVRFVYRQISDPLYWARTPLRRTRVEVAMRRASHVVALSTALADVLRRHYRLPADRITVIPNAVPADDFRPATAEESARARRLLGCPDDGVVLLSLAALVPEKGVDLAIRAAAAEPVRRLLVVGDGDQRGDLEALAERVAPGRVRFLGRTDRPVEALRAADVMVFPTRGGDSMPAAVIEAGLCGLPVVATPVGSIPEVVVDATTGRIVPIADQGALDAAVAELVDDPGMRRRYGEAARRRCLERFTIEATAPRWRDLLTAVARAPSGTARPSGPPPPRA